MGTPVSVHGGAQPKTHRVDGIPLLPPLHYLPHPISAVGGQEEYFSSTLSGENGEDIIRRDVLFRNIEEKRKILEEQNRKIFHHSL